MQGNELTSVYMIRKIGVKLMKELNVLVVQVMIPNTMS